jgi:hypothetical protein
MYLLSKCHLTTICFQKAISGGSTLSLPSLNFLQHFIDPEIFPPHPLSPSSIHTNGVMAKTVTTLFFLILAVS